jgi:hypothetical protein
MIGIFLRITKIESQIERFFRKYGFDRRVLRNCAVTDSCANYNALVCVKSKPMSTFKSVVFDLILY